MTSRSRRPKLERMTNIRWIKIGTAFVLAGAAAWFAKLSVIIATDGRVNSTGAAAVFFLLGAALLVLGAAALGLWLARGRPVVVRVAAALVGPVVFFLSMNIIDSGAKTVLGDLGPAYAEDEWGILFTAILWLAIGLAAVQRLRPT